MRSRVVGPERYREPLPLRHVWVIVPFGPVVVMVAFFDHLLPFSKWKVWTIVPRGVRVV